ncbi:MAG: NADH-quinone oxidoreductase subunit [Solirubrobacterales bacterium]|nr:NADH-quinone oxidoreductase subunit [Solirubrobacterales bacterium]
MIAAFTAPHIDYAGISPIIALTAGVCIVLMAGVFKAFKPAAPALAIVTLATTAGLAIWQWNRNEDLVSGALRLDALALSAVLIACFAGAVAILYSVRDAAAEQAGAGEFCSLVLGSVLGMTIFAEAQNLVSFFVGLELLSIPLYILCAADVKRASSLESGLKYLVIGSLGSATLLYGLALLYGGGGSTSFNQIAAALNGGAADDTLVLIGTAMVLTGLAFKTSLAPFHQWTPDVYEGAPTPVTAFMAVATKAAAFIAFVRLFEVALGPLVDTWDTGLAALAVISIVVGNAGALNQDSLKRLLGYSGIAQAGYMLAGIVVANETGLEALVFYLAAYCLMNLAVFGVVIARERESGRGDDISAFEGIGRTRPILAWPLTIGMLALAGLPATAGFMGKLFLIEAAVNGGYTWLGVAIVIGSMVSLVYYMRVIAAMWMRPTPTAASSASRPGAAGLGEMPAIAGAAIDEEHHASRALLTDSLQESGGLLTVPALVCAAATVVFGVAPDPLINFAHHAATSLTTFV